MEEEDKGLTSIDIKIVEPKEGERYLLSSNIANTRSPSFEYQYTSLSDGLDKAFDLLFEEVISCNTNIWKQQN